MPKKSLLLACLLSGNVFAQMGVSILNAQYERDLSLNWTEFTMDGHAMVPHPQSMAETTTSAAPISNTITSPNNPKRFATASADMFSVSTATSAFPNATFTENSGFAKAIAESKYTFRTLTDGVAPLAFNFDGSGQANFSQGFVSLFDLTLNQSLFYYSWERFTLAGNIPWNHFTYDAALNLSPELFSSHTYALSMNVGTDANTDSQSMAIRMGGLQPIASPAPEPETWAMMLLGLGGVLVVSRGNVRRGARLARPETGGAPTLSPP